jgi:hypothetical protein
LREQRRHLGGGASDGEAAGGVEEELAACLRFHERSPSRMKAGAFHRWRRPLEFELISNAIPQEPASGVNR